MCFRSSSPSWLNSLTLPNSHCNVLSSDISYGNFQIQEILLWFIIRQFALWCSLLSEASSCGGSSLCVDEGGSLLCVEIVWWDCSFDRQFLLWHIMVKYETNFSTHKGFVIWFRLFFQNSILVRGLCLCQVFIHVICSTIGALSIFFLSKFLLVGFWWWLSPHTYYASD